MAPSVAEILYGERSGTVEVVTWRHDFKSEHQRVWTRADGAILQKSFMENGAVTRIVEPLDILDFEWEGSFEPAPDIRPYVPFVRGSLRTEERPRVHQ